MGIRSADAAFRIVALARTHAEWPPPLRCGL
jgi:hypothetical protein